MGSVGSRYRPQMLQLNTDSLLAELRPDAPSGDDLSYDGAFMELERAVIGGPQERIVGPDVPPDGPDWRAVEKQALSLFHRTKDLRVAVMLTKALLRTGGYFGFRDGTFVVRELLARYWDSVHPQLLEEDDFSPIMRVNALRDLCDRVSVLNPLRSLPLVSLPQLGTFSLRDIGLARGEFLPPSGVPVPDMSAIDAAFEHCPVETLAATASAVRTALDNVVAIETSMAEKVGAAQGVSLEDLATVLRQADKILRERLSGRSPVAADAGGNGVDTESAADAEPSLESNVLSSGGSTATGTASAVKIGEISSRNEVIRALEAVCRYYERHEPSSPVPILLRRAQRLVPKSFMDIMRDLAPSAMSDIEKIQGPQDESQN
jgi:type VI secretion system protein ImpA